jgi:hypothetical protein
VRGDQQGEPGQAEEPGEDSVGTQWWPRKIRLNPSRYPGNGQDDTQGDAEAAGVPARDEIGPIPAMTVLFSV